MATSEDHLKTILTLENEIWHQGINMATIREWVEQFTGQVLPADRERDLALALLARLMFFGQRELEILCKSLFTEHLWCEIAHRHRREHGDTTDVDEIIRAVEEELENTLIVGPGSPADSGPHLLYYFRNANRLRSDMFITSAELMSRNSEELKNLRRIVLLDDLCGTGKTAGRYHNKLIAPLLARHQHLANASLLYLTLFATAHGLREARKYFKSYAAMFIDDTYKCFGLQSRYFDEGGRPLVSDISRQDALNIFTSYGKLLYRRHPLGYKDSQLLLAFSHNTPNNSLPVLWSNGTPDHPWYPILRRHVGGATAA